MGRRSIRNIDAKIMNEVMRETFQRGIGMVSTKGVAKRLHVSEPMIFAHFKTKQNLIDQTFAYSWGRIPQETIFPNPDVNIYDPQVYASYVSRFNEILNYPKELVYSDAYLHSSFYNADFAEDVMASMFSRLVPVFQKYQTGRSLEQRRLMVYRYIQSTVSALSQIAHGYIARSDENIRIAIGTILFGTYGLLTEFKSIN
jgi:AcrR family transcriptional regulator